MLDSSHVNGRRLSDYVRMRVNKVTYILSFHNYSDEGVRHLLNF